MPPLTSGEPGTLHDPLEVVRDLLKQEWKAPRALKPTIDLRSLVQDPNVSEDDYVLVYHTGEEDYQRRGHRHRREDCPVSVDIRTESRPNALAIRDEVRRIVDRLALRPDRFREWDEWRLEGYHAVADFPAFQHLVVDTVLVKHARLRTLQRALGG